VYFGSPKDKPFRYVLIVFIKRSIRGSNLPWFQLLYTHLNSLASSTAVVNQTGTWWEKHYVFYAYNYIIRIKHIMINLKRTAQPDYEMFV